MPVAPGRRFGHRGVRSPRCGGTYLLDSSGRFGQPEGLPDSSRWSQRSGDHRIPGERIRTPRGVPERPSCTPPGCLPFDESIRWSATTGYSLTTLRVVEKVRSDVRPAIRRFCCGGPLISPAHFDDFQRAAKQRSELSPARGFASLGLTL
jgi:hypothetical protein